MVRLVIFIFVLLPLSSFAQEIDFLNGSFEGKKQAATLPIGWRNCGFISETPPDTQPNPTFRVSIPPKDGGSYLGLVSRDNDTYESVGQKLGQTLKAGQCYRFSVSLARSPSYISPSRTTRVVENFSKPLVFRFYGGNGYCDKSELLFETGGISHTSWRTYTVEFTPSRDCRYVILGAYFVTPVFFPYNGNLLIDDLSPIVVCEEDPEAEPIVQNPIEGPVNNSDGGTGNNGSSEPGKPPVEEPDIPETPSFEIDVDSLAQIQPEINPGLERSKLENEVTMTINDLYFPADSSKLLSGSYGSLNEILNFLIINKDLKVEVGGHTNDVPIKSYCDWLSMERAKAVRNYLLENGIEPERIIAKGYGKDRPIASNKSLEGRRKNQRVELKVIGKE